MRIWIVSLLFAAGLLTGSRLLAEQPTATLPEAPTPRITVALPASGLQNAATELAPQESSSAQPAGQIDQRRQAEEQVEEQKHQRVVGILPNFNVSYRSDAASMTAKQKIGLALRSEIDPMAFMKPFLSAGYHEIQNDNRGFGWGAEGYGKRVGAAYLNSFDSNMLGNGVFPALLHQDPRYFRLGHGTFGHRVLYAMASSVICRHDNSHRWEPNYSNIAGNLAAGGISNLYYPSGDTGVGHTFSTGLTETAMCGVGSVFHEFWPDVARKFLHKDPTNGLDAQAREADAAAKQAREDK